MTVTADNSEIIPNQYPITGRCTGVLYTITALGGYNIHQAFPTITLAAVNPISKYDLTNALQVQLSVSTFNAKLGNYNSIINRFPNDTITLNAAEFIAGINASRIISLGTYSTLYSDFINYVNSYFSYAGGFTSLFASVNTFDFNNGIFDANAFIALISEAPVNGVPQVTGTITIYNVNNLLQYAVDANVFGNRANIAGNTISTGFLDGDLILVPAGTTITLDLQIDLGSSNIPSSGLHQVSSSTIKYGDYRYSVSTVAAMNNISRVLTAPLLIKLKNI